ncbi:hypothetical protein L0B53_00135 [Vibrio sp. SS-MA-C1-2]|uniref:DUF4886 domain-containing protein n=1 Tax=Vibrio sp. SS-MA-C1-2 TaxID=2908646 RepID=UPI001F37319D|nr:DUF4886 domain-containing protein [Vibrio sp. SS-MA-C1-2]UJF17220.1 hypothetical protein L0B53_00135 [Vibrio sp. SS-MA-C1-2]
MKLLKYSAIGLTIISASCFAKPQADHPSQTLENESKIVALYGNSYTHYNNHLNTRLRDLTRSLKPNNADGYSYRGLAISSGRLGWHENNLKFQYTQKDWDTVVFQGHSTEPITNNEDSRKYFEKSAKQMASYAQSKGSQVVFMMTWAKKSEPEKFDDLAEAYINIAEETNSYVAPVGLAFEKAINEYPEIELYHTDGSHPSLAGSYLAAATLYSTLYNASPEGGAIPIDTDMKEDVAQKLQQVAWETVSEFRTKY